MKHYPIYTTPRFIEKHESTISCKYSVSCRCSCELCSLPWQEQAGNEMNQSLQLSFRALSDNTRRQILIELGKEDLTITEVVEKFDLTRTAVRKHLSILAEGNLISITPRGKERVTRLNPEGLRSTAAWFHYFDQYWDTALGSLKNAVESNVHDATKEKRK